MAREGADARHDMQDTQDAHTLQLAAIREDVHEIKETLAGFQGFWKGAMFMLTLLGAGIGALIATVWHKITGP